MNFKISNNYALQVDEATDIHKDAHLIVYVRFVDECNMREELFFCEPILKTKWL
jgi:CRISPR/Cas system-associated exonuclease Cas4 (RecB family)